VVAALALLVGREGKCLRFAVHSPRFLTARPSPLALMLGLLLLSVLTPWAAPKPHTVVFLGDDHSVLDAEVYGNAEVRTPNLRRLTDAGMTFTHAFVASPSCAPSRAALLTGLMPARNGAEANHSKPRAEIKKLPAYLKELGYEVVAFGKVAHYRHTQDYGFDHFAFDGFHQHASIAAAEKFLRERKGDKPLCIFVGSNWPHVPWPEESEGYSTNALALPPTLVPTPETRRALALYYSAVSRLDAELGRIYDTARATLVTNTIFLHTSDHGAQLPFAKWNLYDAGTRVSLIVSWPGVVKPKSRTDAMVSWVDILPTLVEVAGGRAPEEIDGRSFAAVLRGEKSTHRDHIFTTHSSDGKMNVYPMRAVRTADWKLILNLHPEFSFHTHIDRESRADMTGGYWSAYWLSWTNAARTNAAAAAAVKRYHERPAEELYDLRRDPHETNNLARLPEHAARVKNLRANLDVWMRAQGDARTIFGEPRLLSGKRGL
jgi:N-sulfoglucosamine sulfohydrolase